MGGKWLQGLASIRRAQSRRNAFVHRHTAALADAQISVGTTPRSKRHRSIALLGSAFIAAAALFGAASPATAHDELVGVAGELSADQSRIDLTLSFNNEVMDVGAESVVTAADGSDLADGAPVISGRDVTQSIIMPGFDETITVAWRVVSSDGHPISNVLAFAVIERDGGTEIEFRDVEAVPAVSDDEDHADHDHDHGDEGHDHDARGDKALSDQHQAIEPGLSPGGWVAIAGAIVVVVGGIIWWVIAKKRK